MAASRRGGVANGSPVRGRRMPLGRPVVPDE